MARLSIQNSVLTYHGRMADEAYWEGPTATRPQVGFMDGLRDELMDRRSSHAATTYRRIFEHCVQTGYTAENIPDGEETPLLTYGSPALLRIVLETRQVGKRLLVEAGIARGDSPSEFAQKGWAIDDQGLYAGPGANISFTRDDGPTVTLRKHLYYVQSSSSGAQLSGLHSANFGARIQGYNALVVPGVVGAIYGKAEKSISKIASAQILRPLGGDARRKAEIVSDASIAAVAAANTL